MIGSVAAHILALPGWVALLVVFALPGLESSAFVGFVFPGEVALILGGVLAFEGRLSLAAVLVAGILGAVAGDSVGYAVGRRYGRGLLDGTLGRLVKREHLDRAEAYLAQRGGPAVFFGRFTAALRVMIPGLAGMSRLRYRTFLVFNVAGAVGWVTLSVLLGYLGGSSWRHVEHVASRIGLVALVGLVAVVVAGVLARRGASPLRRLGARFVASPQVRRAGDRFPRASAWVIARADPRRPTGLPLTLAVAVAVGATWTFLGITQDVATHEELARLDPGIHAWVLAHRTATLDAFFRTVTWLGASVVTVPVLLAGAVLLVRRRHSWAPVVPLVAVYGVAVVLHAVVAELVHRQRPPAADWLAGASGFAYTSGHTTQAVAAWGVLALLASSGAARATRVRLAAAAALVAVVVGLSRVYLGVHWPTDVLGGATMSVAVLAWWGVVHLSWFSTVDPAPVPAADPAPVPAADPVPGATAASEPAASERR